MLSFVNDEPSARGCGVCAMRPSGVTRNDSFSTPLRPPCSTSGCPLLMSAARRRSNTRSMTALIMDFPGGLPADPARQHFAQHAEIAAQAVERIPECGGPVALEEEVPDPRERVPRHGHDPQQ